MKEVIAQDVKVELARKIRDDFPLEFFTLMEKLAGEITDDSAADFMWKKVEELEGVFDIEKLRRFEDRWNTSIRAARLRGRLTRPCAVGLKTNARACWKTLKPKTSLKRPFMA